MFELLCHGCDVRYLTSALELLRKKIEMSTERICLAKQKEEQAQKVCSACLNSLCSYQTCNFTLQICDTDSDICIELTNYGYAKVLRLYVALVLFFLDVSL